MTEVTAQKKEMSPDQAQTKHIRSMPNKQLSNRIKRLARVKDDMYTIRWATILSVLMDSSRETGGRTESYLR